LIRNEREVKEGDRTPVLPAYVQEETHRFVRNFGALPFTGTGR